MSEISLHDVRKSFGATAVIRGVDLEVRDGEFLVLVGPSGCGKSTLLRMIAGLEGIDAGELRIDGRRANELAPSQRGCAMVFQSYALYPHMTVAQNMGFSLRMSGEPRAAIDAAVAHAAQMLRITELLARYPRQLSGGQRQRVAIGRAIVRKPGFFLFDEPLSNLDAALRVQMRIELSRLHQDLGATMIYVTHDQVEAMTMGDRIALFNLGRIEQVGAPLELYQDPANEFVAGFLGSPRINLLPAALLPGGAMAGAARVGVRPEHWQLLPEGGLAAQVVVGEHLGSEIVVHARVAGLDELVTVKLPAQERAPETGVVLHLMPQPGRALGFDAEGRRLRAAPAG